MTKPLKIPKSDITQGFASSLEEIVDHGDRSSEAATSTGGPSPRLVVRLGRSLKRFWSGRLRTREFQKTLISSMNEGLVVYDRELRHRVWNPFMERLTGLSAADVVGTQALELFPHLVEQGVDKLLYRAMEGEPGTTADRQFRVPSTGKEGWVVGRYGPHHNAVGVIVGVIGLIQDITERKRVEQALAESERQLAIHNSVAEAFLTVPDAEMYGRVLDVVLDVLDSKHGVFGFIDRDGNLVCPSMTRDIFEQCEMPGKSVVFPKESWGGIWGRTLTEKRPILSNLSGNVPDGHIEIQRCVFVPIIEREELIGLLAVANREVDYSEADREMLESIAGHIAPILHARLARDDEERARLKAEVDLRESERRYRAIIEEQTEFVERFTADGTVTFINNALCRFIGVDLEDFIGTCFLNLLDDDDREKTKRHLASLTRDNPVGENEVIWVAPDGTTRRLSWTNRALFDDDGNFVEFQSVGRDITEQKLAADNLRWALSEKDALLREIHHRVKNNMAVILSMLSLQCQELSNQESVDAITDIRSRIRVMALAHDQIYRSGDFGRIDLGEYVENLTRSLAQVYPERSGRIGFRIRIADVAMAIDTAIPCGLILNELISNSLEHAFPDLGTGEIVVTFQVGDDQSAVLGVSDNGIGAANDPGVPPQYGLGLELVGLLAKQLGGDVEMRWDSGTDVIVRFSLDDQ